MFCPKCGSQIADGSMFCGVCGNQMSGAQAPQQDFQQPQYQQPMNQQYQQNNFNNGYNQPVNLSNGQGGYNMPQQASSNGSKNLIIGIVIVVLIAAVLVLGGILIFKGVKSAGGSDDDGSSKSSIATKSKLKTANSNAKLVFTTVNNELADSIAEGRLPDLPNSGVVVSIDDLKDSDNEIDKAIYNSMKDNGDDSGYVYYEVDQDYNVKVAQWSESRDEGIVGQYPDPETDYKEKHEIGEKF